MKQNIVNWLSFSYKCNTNSTRITPLKENMCESHNYYLVWRPNGPLGSKNNDNPMEMHHRMFYIKFSLADLLLNTLTLYPTNFRADYQLFSVPKLRASNNSNFSESHYHPHPPHNMPSSQIVIWLTEPQSNFPESYN